MAKIKKEPSVYDMLKQVLDTPNDPNRVLRTQHFADAYAASKREMYESTSAFSHPEYMERAELLAEQIKGSNNG